MTDHLADARACLSRVDQAAAHFSAVSWLTATCEHILDHLEAQQTEASLRRGLADITAGRTVDLGSFAQPATAPPAAQQGDNGYTPLPHEGFARLVDGGVHLGKPDSVAQAEGHRWLAGIRAEARAQALAPIREALAGHPRCDIHPDDDPIKCGWKRAVADIQAALDRQEQS